MDVFALAELLLQTEHLHVYAFILNEKNNFFFALQQKKIISIYLKTSTLYLKHLH